MSCIKLHSFYILDKFQLLLWTQHLMHWLSQFNGTGLIPMEESSMVSSVVGSTLKWQNGKRLVIIWKLQARPLHWLRQILHLLEQWIHS